MMKKRLLCIAVILMLLSACGRSDRGTETGFVPETETHPSSEAAYMDTVPAETAFPETEATEPAAAEPEMTEPAIIEPEHSPLYLPGVAVEDVIVYFNEVVLDSEIINSGDPSLVQKWTAPIFYTLEGDCTEEDLATLHSFEEWLNGLEGFPGIYPAEDSVVGNLRICFTDQEGMLARMGPDYAYMDGGVTFWYMDNEIYDAIICCRTELDQNLRNSVILEEIYNGLGPVQDTLLRPDSIICQEYAEHQWLTAVDELLLRLLYHPDILPGMDADECEKVIRRLYY